MLLDNDTTLNESVIRNVKSRKNLKNNIKQYVNWFISQNISYPSSIEFLSIYTGRKLVFQTEVSLINTLTGKDWVRSSQIIGSIKTRKTASQLIVEDLYTKIVNYLEENDINIADYKIKYLRPEKWH